MSLKNSILHITNIRPQDAPTALLVFLYSFFQGIFLTFFFVPANSLFFKEIISVTKHSDASQAISLLGIPIDLSVAFIVAGLLGYFILSGYSFLMSRISPRLLSILNQSAILFILLLFQGMEFQGEKLVSLIGGLEFERWQVSFVLFIMIGPFFTLAAFNYNGLFFKLFDFRQGKWLVALLGSGEILAAILGFFSIPTFLLPALEKLHVTLDPGKQAFMAELELLIISGIGLLLAQVVAQVIFAKFKGKFSAKPASRKGKKRTSFIRYLFSDRYFVLVTIVAMTSIGVSYMANFGFLRGIELIKVHLSETGAGGASGANANVADFIALFYGVVRVLGLVLSLISGKLVNQFGMKFGVGFLPVAVFSCTALAIIVGLLWGNPVVLFLFLALSRLMDRVMRKSLAIPSLKVLFQPLPAEEKAVVQPAIGGAVSQLGIAITGGFLFLFTHVIEKWVKTELNQGLEFILIIFAIVMLLTAIFWMLSAFNLVNRYKEKLHLALASKKNLTLESDHQSDTFSSDVLTFQLKESYPPLQKASLAFINEVNPLAVLPDANQLLKDPSPAVRKEAVKVLGQHTLDKEILDTLLEMAHSDPDPEVRRLAALGRKFDQANLAKPAEVDRLLFSSNPDDKERLLQYLALNEGKKDAEFIASLLKDRSRDIRISALELAKTRKSPNLKAALVELLDSPENIHIGAENIIEYGDAILDELELLYAKTKSNRIKLKVVEILAKIGTDSSRAILLSNLDDASIRIQKGIIAALRYNRYECSTTDRTLIKAKIEETAGNLCWLYACLHDLEQYDEAEAFVAHLEKEKEDNLDSLFVLLSFIYGYSSINLIKENFLNNQSKAEAVYATELIDNTVEDDIKENILPLFEDAPAATIIRHLQNVYPQQEFSFEGRLTDILNRDYSRTSLWLKTEALILLGEISDPEDMPIDIIACLFNAHQILYETASLVLYNKAPNVLAKYYEKLSPARAEILRGIFKTRDGINNLLYEKVKILLETKVFADTYKDELISVAELLKYQLLKQGEKVLFETEEEDPLGIVINVFGVVSMYERGQKAGSLSAGELFIKDIDGEDQADYLEAEENSGVLLGNKFRFFNRIADEPGLTKNILDNIASREGKTAKKSKVATKPV